MPQNTSDTPLTYESYLQLTALLKMQTPRSDPAEHDETLFIIAHQTYELWFKLLLHELEKIGRDYQAGRIFDAIHTWKRCRTVMKTLVGQIDILETMTPMSFAGFRHRLETASGFQSVQYREMEFLLGFKRPEALSHAPLTDPRREILIRRLHEPSLIDHFHRFLADQGAAIPPEFLARPMPPEPRPDGETSEAASDSASHQQVQAEILRLFRQQPQLGILFELMTDFDEGLQEWRYRHIKMVERTIGNHPGTGGSLGVAYLRRFLFLPVFPDLWAIRHRL